MSQFAGPGGQGLNSFQSRDPRPQGCRPAEVPCDRVGGSLPTSTPRVTSRGDQPLPFVPPPSPFAPSRVTLPSLKPLRAHLLGEPCLTQEPRPNAFPPGSFLDPTDGMWSPAAAPGMSGVLGSGDLAGGTQDPREGQAGLSFFLTLSQYVRFGQRLTWAQPRLPTCAVGSLKRSRLRLTELLTDAPSSTQPARSTQLWPQEPTRRPLQVAEA